MRSACERSSCSRTLARGVSRHMRRAELVQPGVIEMREVPRPEPAAGEVVLHIEAALTCGTDIKTYQRGHPKIPLPAPLGHEFSGTITAVGAGVDRFREGDAVACTPTASCGVCRVCERRSEEHTSELQSR